MSLSSSLATAMTALRANQAALSIVSSNVGNAQTPGYVSRTINQVAEATGDVGSSVRVTGVSRTLDQFVQSQLRSETSGGAYADQMSSVLTQLQSVSTTSGSASTQISAAQSAQSLAQQLNATTQGIQTLRSNMEQDLNISVGQANAAMN